MTTLEIGQKLAALCREGKPEQAVESLYHRDIVSIEAAGMPEMPREQRGLKAVLGKAKWWNENHVIHGGTVDGPWPHDDRFICHFTFDVTMKSTGQRIKLDEAALYTVKDGKIIREEFFYKTT
jgi:hypothetical protein